MPCDVSHEAPTKKSVYEVIPRSLLVCEALLNEVHDRCPTEPSGEPYESRFPPIPGLKGEARDLIRVLHILSSHVTRIK